jgi:hypothetical protein
MMTASTSTDEPITAIKLICDVCEGFGWSLWDGLPCRSCGGTGNSECGKGFAVLLTDD